MIAAGFGLKRPHFDPPIEMRFVDLFMVIVTVMMFITVMLSTISAFVGAGRVDVAPRIMTTALPAALQHQRYSLTLAVVGGTSPYSWRISEGSLPPGLALNSETGVISGIATNVATAQFSVQLLDSERRADQRQLSLAVRDIGQMEQTPIRITHPLVTLPDAIRGRAYNFRFVAEGGNPPYRWSLAGGRFPFGLEVTPSGEIIGVPQKDNPAWDFTVAATDATGVTLEQQARVTVTPPSKDFLRRLLSGLATTWKWLAIVAGTLILLQGLWILVFGHSGGVIRMRRKRGVLEMLLGGDRR